MRIDEINAPFNETLDRKICKNCYSWTIIDDETKKRVHEDTGEVCCEDTVIYDNIEAILNDQSENE
jgi:RNase P subunit RPR2